MKRLTKHIKVFLESRTNRFKLLAVILVVGVIISIANLLTASGTIAAWWDDTWHYRKRIPVTNNTTEETSVYISVSLDVSDSTKVQTTCTDIRFTKENGEILPFYVATDNCGNGSAINSTFHVYFDTFPAGLQDIYIYYGNTTASPYYSGSDFATEASNYTVGSIASEENTPGPVAYWKFDEGVDNTCSGGTNDACDSTSNGNDGAKTGATWQSEEMCVSGKCLHFDGSGDYLTRADDSDFDFAASDSFSITAWFRHPDISTSADVLLAKYEAVGVDGGYKVIMESDGDITCAIDDDNTFGPDDSATSTTANYDDSKWHQVTCVKSGTSSLTLYIDGQQIAEDSSISATGTLANDDALYVGIDGDGSSSGWDGFIDELKVYRYVRSAAEVKNDFLQGSVSHGASASFGLDSQKFLSDGLIGYWKMDESSWTNDCATDSVTDYSGNSNEGDACPATTGPTGGATGKFGYAGDFDGSDDYISIPSATAPTNLSVSMWVYVDDYTTVGSYPRLISKQGAFDLQMYTYSGAEGRLEWDIRIPAETDTQTTISDALQTGAWYYLTTTFDGESAKIFINGVEAASRTAVGSISSSNSNPIRIGSNLSQYFDGKIDDVRIYNRALSPAEIADLYNWAPGPVGYWPMNENTGTSTTYDKSGNANNGTMTGSMTEGDWVPGKFGSALEFDGSDDYISTPLTSSFSAVTVSAWVKTPDITYSRDGATGNQTVVGKWANGNKSWNLRITNGIIEAQISPGGNDNGETEISTYTLSNNTWAHVAFTYDDSADTVVIYKDGVAQSFTNSVTMGGSTGVQIGRITFNTNTDRNWKGLIDDVKIYNYARTPEQIVADMNAGHPVPGSPVGSPVGYWKFDEGYGTTANNSGNAGSTLNGTISGATWTNSGKYNKALSFDNNADRVYITDTTGSPLDITANITLSAWVYSTAEQDQFDKIISKYKGSASYPYSLQFDGASDDKIYLDLYDGSSVYTIASDESIPQNTWTHIIGTYDGSIMKLYINGKLQSDIYQGSFSLATNNENLIIGGRLDTNIQIFSGTIDEVKIYNFALSADQVKTEYNQGKAVVFGANTDSSGNPGDYSATQDYCPPGSGACTGPELEWLFDDKSTSSVGDTSGKGHTGTITGASGVDHGINGSSIQLNSSGDRIVATDSDSLTPSSFALSFWMRWNEAQSGWPRVGKMNYASGDAQNEYSFQFEQNDGRWYARFNNSATIINQGSGQSLDTTLNKWHHFVMTYDNSTNKLLIVQNGSRILLDTTVSLTIANSAYDFVAFHAASNSIDYDQIRFYNYSYGFDDIAWEYNRGKPVGWWKFDECQGTTAYDSGSGGNNGTITPGDTSGDNDTVGSCSSGASTEMWNDGATGKRNASLGLDGTNDYVDAGTASALSLTGQISISAWVKTSSTSLMAIAGRKNATSTAGYLFGLRGSASSYRLTLFYYGSFDAVSNSNAYSADGQWHHFMVTYDQNTVRFYTDGKPVGTVSQTAAGTATTTPNLSIGALNDASGAGNTVFLNGQVDEVKIWNYALTASQVKSDYNNGAVSFE